MEKVAVLLLFLLHHGNTQDWTMRLSEGSPWYMEAGKNVDISCYVAGVERQDDIDMKWYTPDMEEVPTDDSQRIFSRKAGRVIRLYIKPVRESDAGSYRCAANVNGVTKIIGIQTQIYKEITFTNAPRNQTQYPGSRGFIVCEVDGMPKPEVKWYFNGSRIGNEGSHYKVEKDGLGIEKVSHLDEGDYICRAEIAELGMMKYVHIAVTLHKNIPARPRGITASETTPTSVTLQVQPPNTDGGSPITAYEFTYDSNKIMASTKHPGTVFTFTLKDLRPSTHYTVNARAVNAIGVGPAVIILITTDSIRSPYPVVISSSPEGTDPGSYLLTWEEPRSGGLTIRGYRIKYGLVHSDSFEEISVVDDPSSPLTSYRIGHLKANKTYRVLVQVFNDIGWSAPGGEFTFTTHSQADIPARPRSVTASETTPTSVTLQVQPPNTDGGSPITAYEFAYGNQKIMASTKQPDTVFTFTLKDLRPSTQYTVNARAVNAIGVGPAVIILITTDSIRSPYPVVITSSPEGTDPDSYLLTWEEPRSGGLTIRGYKIQYGLVHSDSFKEISVVDDPSSPITSYRIGHLEPNTTYRVLVRVFNDIGWSAPSEDFTFTTGTQADIPARPRSVTASETTSTSVTLQVQPPNSDGGSPITAYEFTYGSNKIMASTKHPGTVIKFTLENLRPSMQYTVNVRAVNAIGVGPAVQISFTTDSINEESAKFKLSLSPSSMSIQRWAGASFMVECSVTGLSEGEVADIMWYANEQRIENGSSRVFVRSLTNDSQRLYVFDVMMEDAGNYTCQAVKDGGTVNKTVYLNVLKDITFDKAPLTQYPWSGTDALIQCEASGDPVPTVWWRKQGEVIKSGGRFVYEPAGLRIYKITRANTGLYTCVAEVAAEGRVKETLISVIVR